MFKFLTIVVLLYVMYKLVFPTKAISSGHMDHLKDQHDETIDIDYEEVD